MTANKRLNDRTVVVLIWGLLFGAVYGCSRIVEADNADRAQQQAALPAHQREVSSGVVLEACQSWVKDRFANPSTVKFTYFLSDMQTKPGATAWFTKFTARNDYNLEKRFDFRCQVAWDGTVTAAFGEDR